MKAFERRTEWLPGHVVGLATAVAGAGIVASAAVDAIDRGPDVMALAVCGTVTASAGTLLWRTTAVPRQIRVLDVFTTVTLAWVALAVAGAVPFLVTGSVTTPDDALFESISGFTTTGATVLRPIEDASAGVLFWRATSHWLGGMGVIVLVVAVLPTVGSGGLSLLEAESPGPTGERLTPRVRQTARHLWAVYLGFTVALVIAYALAGMSLFDAVTHSFAAVSTGGFSPHSASIGHFGSGTIEWITIVAMFLAGGSFTLYFRALRGNPRPLLRSAELHLYIAVVAVATTVVYVTSETGAHFAERIRDSAFAVVSVVTTTGFVTADFGRWGQASQSVLLLLMPIGAMAGSTAGGVKLVRVLAVASFAHREALRQLHPRLVRPIRVGGAILPDPVAARVVAFLVLALATFGGGAILIALTGADLVTSFSAAATSFGNVGPGLGAIGPSADFLEVPRLGRAVAMVQMLLGRLEIYPVILALSVVTLKRRRRRVVT